MQVGHAAFAARRIDFCYLHPRLLSCTSAAIVGRIIIYMAPLNTQNNFGQC